MGRQQMGWAVAVSLVALAATGCADRATVRYRPGYAIAPTAPAAPYYPPSSYPPSSASAYGGTSRTATGPCAPPPCAPPPPPAPCEPPPCAPAVVPCGLPCEQGISQWHVRGVYGWATMAGDDAGDPCLYYGADVGRTLCGCFGVDAFYRHTCARFDRDSFGEDGGSIHFAGLKGTYERSLFDSNFFGYAGLGVEYFWTEDYIHDDSGVGGFAEVGVGYKFANWGRVRAGVDIHGDFTKVTRQSPVDDGDRRLLWTIAPVVAVEFDF